MAYWRVTEHIGAAARTGGEVAGGARGGLFRLDFRLQLRLDGGVDDGVRGVLGQVARPHRLAAQLPPILVHLGLRGWTGLGQRAPDTAQQRCRIQKLNG